MIAPRTKLPVTRRPNFQNGSDHPPKSAELVSWSPCLDRPWAGLVAHHAETLSPRRHGGPGNRARRAPGTVLNGWRCSRCRGGCITRPDRAPDGPLRRSRRVVSLPTRQSADSGDEVRHDRAMSLSAERSRRVLSPVGAQLSRSNRIRAAPTDETAPGTRPQGVAGRRTPLPIRGIHEQAQHRLR